MMKVKIDELKLEIFRKTGNKITGAELSESVGISLPTLISLNSGRYKTIKPEYVDALCTYFDCKIEELLEIEPVQLPLQLNLRPDKRK